MPNTSRINGTRGGVCANGYLLYADTIGALQYDDYKGPNRQYVEQGKLVISICNGSDDEEDTE